MAEQIDTIMDSNIGTEQEVDTSTDMTSASSSTESQNIIDNAGNDNTKPSENGESSDDFSYEWQSGEDPYSEQWVVDSFLDKVKELKLTPEQFKGLNEWNNSLIGQIQEKAAETQESKKTEAVAQLETEWGKNYENNLAKAVSVVEMLDEKVPGIRDMMINTPLGNIPEMVKLFHSLGELMSEDVLSPNKTEGTSKNEKRLLGSAGWEFRNM